MNVAKVFISKGWPDYKYEPTSVAFDGTYFKVRGRFTVDRFIEVKVDREGNVVGWSTLPQYEPT